MIWETRRLAAVQQEVQPTGLAAVDTAGAVVAHAAPGAPAWVPQKYEMQDKRHT